MKKLDHSFWKKYCQFYNKSTALNIKYHSFHNYIIQNEGREFIESSMLSSYELSLNYALAKDYFSGIGVIVDAGCLLGVSTLSFAKGLIENNSLNKEKRIFCFDLFLNKGMIKAQDYIDITGSCFDRFIANLSPYLNNVYITPGDILDVYWKGEKIEVFFNDISKTQKINDHVIRTFFPYFIPGHTVLVQQDYVYFHQYYIAITMELLKGYFEHMFFVNGGSSVYILQEPIPEKMIKSFSIEALSFRDKISILEEVESNTHPSVKEVIKCCRAYCAIEHGEFLYAKKALESVQFNVGSNEQCEDFSKICFSNFKKVNDMLASRTGIYVGEPT